MLTFQVGNVEFHVGSNLFDQVPKLKTTAKQGFIDRQSSHVAALIKQLQGHRLDADEASRAADEAAYWEADLGLVSSTSFIAGSGTEMRLQNPTLKLLPVLEAALKSTMWHERGLPKIKLIKTHEELEALGCLQDYLYYPEAVPGHHLLFLQSLGLMMNMSTSSRRFYCDTGKLLDLPTVALDALPKLKADLDVVALMNGLPKTRLVKTANELKAIMAFLCYQRDGTRVALQQFHYLAKLGVDKELPFTYHAGLKLLKDHLRATEFHCNCDSSDKAKWHSQNGTHVCGYKEIWDLVQVDDQQLTDPIRLLERIEPNCMHHNAKELASHFPYLKAERTCDGAILTWTLE